MENHLVHDEVERITKGYCQIDDEINLTKVNLKKSN
jgi:hypothetical protein